MNKQIKQPFLKKGNKKLNFKFIKCWFNLHKWSVDDSVVCDLKQDDKVVGECVMTLYYCKKCGKQKLIVNNITL